MARFYDLANELVLEIIHHVLPDDLESFTLTCKNIWIVAKEELQIHRHLKQRYSRLRFSYGSDSPHDILDNILVDYRTALYVKELTFDHWYPAWHGWHGHQDLGWIDELHLPYPEQKMARMRQAASELVTQPQSFEWIQEIEAGDQGPICALLLLLLPNLSTVRIERLGFTDDRFYQILKRAAALRGTDLPLSKLKKIEFLHIYNHRRDRYEDLDMVVLLAALPSITSISARTHCYGQRNDAYRVLPPRSSNVEELTFVSSAIAPDIIFAFLEGFKALRIFAYHSDHVEDEGLGRGKFNPFWISAALLAHARTSLESLTLCSHTMKRRYMGDIRSFQNLTTLVTDLQMLLHKNQLSHHASLANALPAKLEMLKLHCFGQGGEDKIPVLILKLVEMKTRRVPRLRELEVVTCKGIGDFLHPFINLDTVPTWPVRTTQQPSYFEVLHTQCRKAGIELSFKKQFSDNIHAFTEFDYPKWCICQVTAHGSMVKCANDACSHGKEFHVDCVGIRTAVPESWRCPECALEERNAIAATSAKQPDGPQSIIVID